MKGEKYTYPEPGEPVFNEVGAGIGTQPWVQGITLRQHYVGLAMQGLVASYSQKLMELPSTEGLRWCADVCAPIAVAHADALIKELEKEES